MPVKFVDLQQVHKIDDIVNDAVSTLRLGGLVVVPTETVYGVAALASNEKAVQRLASLKGRQQGHAVPLAISGYDMLSEYVPTPGHLGQRLARRCWPGPLTLVFESNSPESPFAGYSDEIKRIIMPNGTVGLRVPNSAITQEILYELNEPVALSSANITGETPAINAKDALSVFGDGVDMILDFGESDLKKPSTVVQIHHNHCEILREGAIVAETIEKLTAKIILFVCTGNTCRSPMAEIICEKVIADQLGCHPDDLENRGYVILSAGVSAPEGSCANPMAQQVAMRYGMNLDDHQSQQLNETLVRFADQIFVMSRSHREVILSDWPSVDTRLHVLRPDGGDIADPIGGNYELYQQCAQQIETAVRERIKSIVNF